MSVYQKINDLSPGWNEATANEAYAIELISEEGFTEIECLVPFDEEIAKRAIEILILDDPRKKGRLDFCYKSRE
jgi:hypothetical protein